ncbi:MAG: hypothetical protein Kow00105_10370 [Phycisphaeraceae bacterium]
MSAYEPAHPPELLQKERERLSQTELLAYLRRDVPMTEMVTVYLSQKGKGYDHHLHCALIPSDQIEQTLTHPTWDLMLGRGMPGAIRYGLGDDAEVKYCRYGSDDGIEPLVFYREYHGMREDDVEIAEEFRHFHRLYFDSKQNRYIKISDSGAEATVAAIEPGQVKIRLKEIRQFLAIKEMHLALLFDYRAESPLGLDELGLQEGGEDTRDGLCVWGLHYGDYGGIGPDRAFSRMLGKRLFAPVSKENSGFWGYAKEKPKQHVDFIIGVDDDGNEIGHTSDPDQLGNFFGANSDAPQYLTPVQFRKQVLDKYYQQPSKYTIESGVLRCGGLWLLQMDNHLDDCVAVWLGDLGRDLPYEEQLHWRSYNIAPVGGVSETYFRRQLMCIATDSDRPEHEFGRLYGKLCKSCDETIGWQILLPLAAEDMHYLQGIRVPSTEEQKDFDDLILSLTKVLVDSLNEKELNALIPIDGRDDIKGSISRLERAFSSCGYPGGEDHIKFLRSLQNLRSAGTAHRKGSNYRKIAQEFDVGGRSLPSVFEGILARGIRFLEFLEAAARSGKLKPSSKGVSDGET